MAVCTESQANLSSRRRLAMAISTRSCRHRGVAVVAPLLAGRGDRRLLWILRQRRRQVIVEDGTIIDLKCLTNHRRHHLREKLHRKIIFPRRHPFLALHRWNRTRLSLSSRISMGGIRSDGIWMPMTPCQRRLRFVILFHWPRTNPYRPYLPLAM